MKWIDFAELFNERRDLSSTLRTYKHIPEYAAVYLFLINPSEKFGETETDIVYIGETHRLGRRESNCRLWDYKTKATDHEKRKMASMEKYQADHKTMISWLPCFNKYIAKKLEHTLLNAFWSEHGKNPPLNLTTPYTREETWGISVDETLKMMRKMKTLGQVAPVFGY